MQGTLASWVQSLSLKHAALFYEKKIMQEVTDQLPQDNYRIYKIMQLFRLLSSVFISSLIFFTKIVYICQHWLIYLIGNLTLETVWPAYTRHRSFALTASPDTPAQYFAGYKHKDDQNGSYCMTMVATVHIISLNTCILYCYYDAWLTRISSYWVKFVQQYASPI